MSYRKIFVFMCLLYLSATVAGLALASHNQVCDSGMGQSGNVPMGNDSTFFLMSLDCPQSDSGALVYSISGYIEPDTISIVTLEVIGNFDQSCYVNPQNPICQGSNNFSTLVNVKVDGSESGSGGFFELLIDTSTGEIATSQGSMIVGEIEASPFILHTFQPNVLMEYGWRVLSTDSDIMIQNYNAHVLQGVATVDTVSTNFLPIAINK